ncbi:MAG: M23 family metallopeptidase [Treponema sp.]|nr:M23 family metallopeptidase [Treponema sp.]
MASVHEYKRLENKIVQKVKDGAGIVGGFILDIFRAIGRFLTRRYTVVFVPHSEKRVYNLHVTVLSITCFFLVVFGVIGAFIWYGSSFNNGIYIASNRDGHLRNTQASLDQMRDETALLMRNARSFQNTVSGVLKILGIPQNNSFTQSTSGDLIHIFGDIPPGYTRDSYELRQLSEYLSQVEKPLKEIGEVLDSQSALLTEIPSIWPVRNSAGNAIGNITMYFGQNIHPIHGQWHIHRGIDIATYRAGDNVVATADGVIVTAEYVYDYGYYIIIRHKHGYYTRYAHLQTLSRVQVGQRVQQGEVISYIGNTGISTGPHLHYEVHIGSDVVDPHRYITIRSSLSRQGR